MWRIRTREEFLATGWILEEGTDYSFDPPSNDQWGYSIDFDKYQYALEKLPQEFIENLIIENTCEEYGDWSWTPSMFVQDTPLVPLCNCSWNKHPLFCKCK